MPLPTKKKIVQLCRKLRQEATDAEDAMWQRVRGRKLAGLKITRQFPVIYNQTVDGFFFFIADFYCHEGRLVIELDGRVHEFQKEYDENRDRILEQLGLNVIRLTNDELETDIDLVLKKVLEAVKANRG